ncbi:MAG: MarR family transcriptional regulator [Chloroflexi bacterium]|nr:MAG: MarR family transcriptional regulator [Chloroflexota bacterium]
MGRARYHDAAGARALYARRVRRPVGRRDIADALGVAASTVTGITDRLVKQGLIERREDTADRRVVRLTLTADGRRLTTEVGEVSRTYLREVFALLKVRSAVVTYRATLHAAAPLPSPRA